MLELRTLLGEGARLARVECVQLAHRLFEVNEELEAVTLHRRHVTDHLGPAGGVVGEHLLPQLNALIDQLQLPFVLVWAVHPRDGEERVRRFWLCPLAPCLESVVLDSREQLEQPALVEDLRRSHPLQRSLDDVPRRGLENCDPHRRPWNVGAAEVEVHVVSRDLVVIIDANDDVTLLERAGVEGWPTHQQVVDHTPRQH
mmetsp:Transcript_57452/g.136624  ORF Transcript_57452/g.136624 Transcript_57452/m.136624 type:complete len:200 (-) Transcript_57452:328-927(-)